MAKPEKKYTCGPVSASVWSGTKVVNGKTVEFHSVTIDKAYKVGEDWKHTNSYDPEDLPKVALVANEAYKYLRIREDSSQ